MSNRERLDPLVKEIEFILAERRNLRARGLHLIVSHLDHVPGTICAPGEMIGDISLGLPIPTSLRLSQMSLLLMDCFCRHRIPLTASCIEQIMISEPFYVDYAANRIGDDRVFAKPDSRTVRVCVSRIRKQMEMIFQELGLTIDPCQILTSEATDSNVTVYRLKATVEIMHVGL